MAAGAAVIRQASAAALIYSTIAQSLVQDAIASPPRRLCYRVRKRTNRSRRRGRGRSSPNSSGPGDDLFYGSGDGGDGGDAGGGSGGGGSSWDSWWWRDEGWRMAVLTFFHQVACWICLIHCLHFLAKSVARLSRGGNLYGSGEATAAVL